VTGGGQRPICVNQGEGIGQRCDTFRMLQRRPGDIDRRQLALSILVAQVREGLLMDHRWLSEQ